jgi:hypothetical protein
MVEGAVKDLVGSAGRSAFEVESLAPAELQELRAWLASRGHGLAEVTPARRRLDEVFLAHVTGRKTGGGPKA